MTFKSFTKPLRYLAAGILCMLATHQVQAQLSGTYTIDANKKPSSTNYNDFTSAVGDMVSGSRSDGGTANGSGISGAVTFNVASGNYNEQISISSISGASSSYTITFQSASADSNAVRLHYASSSSSSSDYVVEMNGADYVTFKQMTIERTGTNTYSRVFFFTGGALFNKILNCRLIGRYTTSTTSTGFQGGPGAIIYSASTDSANLFQNNRFVYGFDGIYMSGSATGNKIIHNTFDSTGSSAIYCLSQSYLRIEDNTMNMGAYPSSFSHYTSYGIRLESSPYVRIVKNKIFSNSNASVTRCIVLFSCTNTSTNRGLIANNMVWVSSGTTSSTGLALANNSYLDIVYNNILMTASVSGSAAFYLYPPSQGAGTDNNLINNNFVHKGGGYVYSITGNTSGLNVVDYNNGYTTGSLFGNWNGTDYKTLSDWQKASSQDANSLSGDPGYVSNKDLHVTSANIDGKGTPFSAVTDDIDGDKRNSSTPDIGADEFTPLLRDIGVTKIDSPSFFCGGTQNVYIKFSNFGVNTITSATINWSVNGSTQTAYSWTGSLASGISSSSIKLGSYNFAANTAYNVKIWTSSPNGSTDQVAKNDTINSVVRSGYSGTFTIGGSNPDFSTISAAIISVSSKGVCGPVILNLRDGTYNEQVTIPEFPGANSTNTVTLQSQSKDSTKVTIEYASSSATGVNDAILQLNGADYVRVKYITFLRTGTNNQAYVIDVTKGASYNILESNRFIGRNLSSAVTTADLIVSLNGNDSSNTFRNNLFKYGNNGLVLTGFLENDNVVEGNIFDSVLMVPMNITYNNRLTVRNNQINNCGYGSGTIYGMLISTSENGMTISGNKVNMNRGALAGMYFFNCNHSASKPGLVANNFVTVAATSTIGAPSGIEMDASSFVTYAFNSINITGANTGSAFKDNSSSSTGGHNLYNNIFSNEGYYAMYVSSAKYYDSSNYNNFYSKATNKMYWGGNSYTTLADLQSGSSKDTRSLFGNPYFKSATDLHTFNSTLNAKAKSLASVKTDIDGDTRSSTPDIGADEFNPLNDEAGITGTAVPKDSVCANNSDVTVILNNFGSNTLSSVNIDWVINGTAQSTYKWTGTLNAFTSTQVKLGTYNFSTPGSVSIKAWTSSPNGKADNFVYNDTVTLSIKVLPNTPANAGTDQDICAGESAVIGSFAVAGISYSWTSSPKGYSSGQGNNIVSPTQTTSYYLHTVTNGGCESFDTVIITVKAAPSPKAGSNQSVCANTPVNLGGSATTGNTYKWTSSPAGFTSSSSSVTVSPQVTTTYYLEETLSATGCSKVDSVKLTVIPGPAIDAGPDRASCSGQPSNIGVTAASNTTYAWTSLPAGFTSGNASVTVSPTTTTTYILNATDSKTGCSTIDSVTITVLTKPQPKITGLAQSCSGDTAIYSTPANTGSSFNWTVTGGTLLNGQSTDKISVIWSNAGAGKVGVREQIGSNGCEDSTFTNVTVDAKPVAGFTAKTVGCVGENISFANTSTNGTSSFWTFGDGASTIDQNTSHTFASAGVYTVTLTEKSTGGCTSVFSQDVTIQESPKAAFTAPAVCIGSDMIFTNASTKANSYKWYFGDGSNSTQSNPIHNYIAAGSYTASLVAYTTAGCSDSTTVQVKVNPLPVATWTSAQVSGRKISFKADNTSATSYAWSFGDGGTGNSAVAEHDYSADGNYQVKLTVVDANGCESSSTQTLNVKFSGIDDNSSNGIPVSVYPNPFSNETNVQYELTNTAMMRISLTDVTGRELVVLHNGQKAGGVHTLNINAAKYSLQQGMYFIRMSANGNSTTVRSLIKVE